MWQIASMCGRLLGLDVGSRTIGVAVCDEGQVVATPLRTLSRRGGRADVEAVRRLMDETGARALVVGLPRELSGKEGQYARRARLLGDALGRNLGCQVAYWDERFSTVEAERVLIAGGARRNKRKQVVDKLAATVILQGYLDGRSGS